MELPYNQVPHAVTELMLLVAQAKQVEGVRLDSFPTLESGYAALKLVRLSYLSHGAMGSTCAANFPVVSSNTRACGVEEPQSRGTHSVVNPVCVAQPPLAHGAHRL